MDTQLDPPINLPPLKERAALLLANLHTQAAVARALKVSKQTVNKWVNRDELFRARLKQLTRDIQTEARERIAASVLDAVDTIVHIAQNGGEPGVVGSQLRAAIYLVDQLKLKRVKGDQVQERHTDVEAEAEAVEADEAAELLAR